MCVYLSFTVFFFVLSFEVESIPWVRKKRRNARATQRFIKSKSRVCAVNVYSGTIGALVTLWHCFPSTIPSSLKSIESLVYFTVASCHVFFQFIFISFVYSLPLSLSLLQHIHFFHLYSLLARLLSLFNCLVKKVAVLKCVEFLVELNLAHTHTLDIRTYL